MKGFLIAVVLVLASVSLRAQNWVHDKATDVMTDETFTVFLLKGQVLDSGLAGLRLYCSKGKVSWAGFAVEGMRFHYDSYASLRNPPYVTYAKVRTGNKVESHAFLVTQDMKEAHISNQEMKKIIQASGAIIGFSDALGTTHYAKFTDASSTPDLNSECSL